MCELGLVLEPDPVMSLMISYGMLWDLAFQHFLGLGVREFALGNESVDVSRQSMDTLIGELADIREEFIPGVPEMLLGLHCSADSIKGKLGYPLTLWGNGPIVNETLDSLSIFTLKHHLQLLPASAPVISLISINCEDLQVIKSPGIEDFPVL